MSEREKLRDDIAMAICMASCGMAAHRSDYMADADAALAALEAAGVRLVPVEATEEMVSAYYEQWIRTQSPRNATSARAISAFARAAATRRLSRSQARRATAMLGNHCFRKEVRTRQRRSPANDTRGTSSDHL